MKWQTVSVKIINGKHFLVKCIIINISNLEGYLKSYMTRPYKLNISSPYSLYYKFPKISSMINREISFWGKHTKNLHLFLKQEIGGKNSNMLPKYRLNNFSINSVQVEGYC